MIISVQVVPGLEPNTVQILIIKRNEFGSSILKMISGYVSDSLFLAKEVVTAAKLHSDQIEIDRVHDGVNFGAKSKLVSKIDFLIRTVKAN